jgi:hypothetical protein
MSPVEVFPRDYIMGFFIRGVYKFLKGNAHVTYLELQACIGYGNNLPSGP